MTLAVNLAEFAVRKLLSAKLTATGTEMIINGLEADTLYRGELLAVAALDGTLGWQSRFTVGGAWDAGGTDYGYQILTGTAATAGAATGLQAFGTLGTQDGGTSNFAPLVSFLLYTGSASRLARVMSTLSYIATDASNQSAAVFSGQRSAAGAITSIRFANVTSANGLGAGSRVFLEKLG